MSAREFTKGVPEATAATRPIPPFTEEHGELRESIRRFVAAELRPHANEWEEAEWFPEVRKGLGRKALQDIGAEMQKARKRAPKKPSQPSALKKTVDAVIK